MVRFIYCILCFIPIFAGCQKEIKYEEKSFKDIALDYAKLKGFSILDKEVIFDTNNIEWDKALSYYKNANPKFANQYSDLTDKEIQSIKIFPNNKATLGGVVWVLIDKNTKEVITFLAEKWKNPVRKIPNILKQNTESWRQ